MIALSEARPMANVVNRNFSDEAFAISRACLSSIPGWIDDLKSVFGRELAGLDGFRETKERRPA
ncbi:hypothetical protein NXC24_PA00200 (plasmid) [Rhizobium sp. NXC24]|nr:hypothetical protein NXC24_PA00200 [Rhizobium sp. NXC24]